MNSSRISPRVLEFLAENIDSVSQLEMLLMMSVDENRLWTVQELGARTYSDSPSTMRGLEPLCRRRLIVGEGTPMRYRIAPMHSDARKLIAEVVETYSRNIIPISNLIHSKASASVTEFARAFDLKKDK